MTLAEFATLDGLEGSEVITWLIMRGALSATVKNLHQDYYLPSMTGIAKLLLENQDQPVPAEVYAPLAAHRAPVGGYRDAGRDVPVHPSAQCQGLSIEQISCSG